MAYDRYDTRRGSRDPSRRPDEHYRDRDPRDYGGREERGFFERAGEQIASWFGDEDDDERGGRPGDRMARDRDPWGPGERDRGYRPVTGDYGRSEGRLAPGGSPRRDEPRGRFVGGGGRDDERRTGFVASTERSRHDPHYQEWRQRQIDDLDRDYDEYRREHQSKFENDFGSWRSNRQTKRQMLAQVREHMEVVGSDGEHVGTIDRVAGERLILTKSDPESGGAHHSLSCTDIGRIEGDKLILDCTADQAKSRWRDDSRERALFEREDQGEAGPHALDRSFSGTYR